jgi:hypothetical protein
VHLLSQLRNLLQLFRSQLHNTSQHNKLSHHQLLPQFRAQLQHKQLLNPLQYWQHQVKQLLNHFAELQVVLLQAWKHH